MQPLSGYARHPQLSDDEKYDASDVAQESLHSAGIPAFAVAMLDRLYGSLYCTLPVIDLLAHGSCHDISTYIYPQQCGVRQRANTILMFRQKEQAIQVINEGMQLSSESIDCFCEYLFSKDTKTMQIDFHAIARSAMTSSRLSLWWSCTEDIVIALPDSTDAYLALLGKSTRKSLRKSLSRAKRELTRFSHCVHEKSMIDKASILQIVDFNRARMAHKGHQSAWDESAITQLIGLIRSHGYAGLLMNAEKMCAGTLACRFGDDVFSLVNAHDPTFDQLGLGNLSRHLTILSAINAGAKRFHLLGGNLASKQAALGKRQRLYHLTVYRTRAAAVSDLMGIARRTASACAYRIRSWLEDRQASSLHGWLGRSVVLLGQRRRRWNPETLPLSGSAAQAAASACKNRQVKDPGKH